MFLKQEKPEMDDSEEEVKTFGSKGNLRRKYFEQRL